MMRSLFYVFFCLCTWVRCADSPRSGEDISASTPDSNKVSTLIASSTVKMAGILAQAYQSIDPMKASYLVNTERAQLFDAQRKQGDVQTRINAWAFYAYELLNAGRTEQAIIELESLLRAIPQYQPAPDTMLRFRRLLALAYLRLGEQANCLNKRNEASCIIPLAAEGQYQMTKGSEAAIRVCLEILSEFPEDEETIWLLNLAAMTIGTYPDDVPERWRLPESFFNAKTPFVRFADISQKVGIKGLGLAGGACMEDFDNDGWLDIITSSWGKNDPLKFWKNEGNGTFTDASASMGLEGINGGLNLLHTDFNNDGLADILVLRGAWLFDQGRIPNSLLVNRGNGRFADITEEVGMLTYAPSQTAAFADFNLDGWVDVFVGNESTSQALFPNEFYLNIRGTFRNVVDQIGVATEGFIKGCVAGDINNDGWPDLYLSNYSGANMLLLNKGVNSNGVPQFENIAAAAGVEAPIISFPCWIWDFDNDGWEDIFVSSYGDGSLSVAHDYVLNARGKTLSGYPHVYRNNGNLTFTDVSQKMKMTENIFTMGCNYGDLDADGYLDFYLGTGNPEYSSVVPNKMFRNNAGKSFDDITAAGGFGHIQKGHGVAFGDLDHDGDEDLFETLGGAFDGDVYENILFENPIGQDKSWVVLQLQGTQSNRMAVGARVKITVSSPSGSHTFYRTMTTGGSFGSSSLQLEVGLDDAAQITELMISWPNFSHTQQTFRNLPVRKYMHITEGNEIVQYPEVKVVDF